MENNETNKKVDNSQNKTNSLDTNDDINKINSLKSKHKRNEVVPHYTKDESTAVDRVTFEGLEDTDSIFFNDAFEKKLPPIPDGGWGWVVVVAAFLVSACADGLAFSFGLLHEEFTAYFETTQSKTSLIGSLFIATPLLAGPIMSALVDRYGCRTMTMVAGLLSTIGFLLASISNSVEMLCLTFGFLSGLAMGILYVTTVVSVAFWFDKKRNLAVSLASCGIGFGTLIYSPLTHYLLEVYDWRNTVVLLAGTLLNMCVCGALMRDPEWLTIKQERERRLLKSRFGRSSSVGSMSSRSIEGGSLLLSPDEFKALLKSGKSPDYILATLATSIAEQQKLEATTQMNADQAYKRIHSDIHLPTFITQNEKVPVEVIEKLMSNKRLYNIILQNFPDLITRRRSEVNINVEESVVDIKNEPAKLPVTVMVKIPKITESEMSNKSDKKTKEQIVSQDNTNKDTKLVKNVDPNLDKKIRTSKIPKITESEMSNKSDKKTKEQIVSQDNTNKDTKLVKNADPNLDKKFKTSKMPYQQTNWLSRQISTDHQYLRDMPLYRNTIMHRGAMMNIPRYKLRASSLPDIYRNSMWSLGSESDDEMKWYHRLWQTAKSTFDFRMFTEFHFLMFNLSSLILSVWFIVPYFFLKSYMTAHNVEGGAMMISIIGVASSIGIVALGWAGDRPWINVTKTYTVCLIICGVSVATYPLFITNYWVLTVISAVFGLSFASSYSYTPAILMELMPIDHFTVAYGLILLSQGIGHLIGPPIGGMLYDLTGTWDLTFYAAGLWLIISGLCVGVIPYTKDMRMCGSAPLLNEMEKEKKSPSDV